MPDHSLQPVLEAAAVIALWPSVADFASDIGIPRKHAQTMKDRNSIPALYWARVARSAAARSIPGITVEKLADIAEAKVERRPEGAGAHP